MLLLSLLGASGSLADGHASSREVRHQAENGMAALTYSADLSKGFVLSATLDLPAKPDNRGWYCVWLMVAETRDTRDLPAMLQVGLMRWDQSQFRAQPFVTTEHPGKGLEFKAVPGFVEGPHRFSIKGDPAKIALTMDNKLLMSVSSGEFFHRRIPVYLKVAAEVWAVGDAISGKVSDIQLQERDAEVRSPVSQLAFEDRGLKFSCLGEGRWAASGLFDPSLPLVRYTPPPCRGRLSNAFSASKSENK